MDRIDVDGRGSDRYMKGSKVMETFLQTGQTNFGDIDPAGMFMMFQRTRLKISYQDYKKQIKNKNK